ncbi:MAG: response regulator [Deltaproteobacteria bacterium]|nr:response regulator [Deltaproteobacteria bacterium]
MPTLESHPLEELCAKSIVVLDDNPRFLHSAKRALSWHGFTSITLAQTCADAERFVGPDGPDVLLVDIHLGGQEDGLAFLRTSRARGFRGLAVVISGDSAPREFFRAAMAEADDFLVKGTRLDLGVETERVLLRGGIAADERWRPRNVTDLGYLRTLGLSLGEIETLAEYAIGFPGHKEMAERMQKTEELVRTTFSRICKKLGIDNLSQLSHLLTVCGMYARCSERIAEPRPVSYARERQP